MCTYFIKDNDSLPPRPQPRNLPAPSAPTVETALLVDVSTGDDGGDDDAGADGEVSAAQDASLPPTKPERQKNKKGPPKPPSPYRKSVRKLDS